MYRVEKKRRGIYSLLLLFLCAFSVGLGIGYGRIQMQKRQAAEAAPQNTAAAQPSLRPQPTAAPERAASLPITVSKEEPPEAEHFFVITQQGSVCVFHVEPNGDKRFSHKLAIEPDALPAADRTLLAEGIYLDSRADLLAFCEDFSS